MRRLLHRYFGHDPSAAVGLVIDCSFRGRMAQVWAVCSCGERVYGRYGRGTY